MREACSSETNTSAIRSTMSWRLGCLTAALGVLSAAVPAGADESIPIDYRWDWVKQPSGALTRELNYLIDEKCKQTRLMPFPGAPPHPGGPTLEQAIAWAAHMWNHAHIHQEPDNRWTLTRVPNGNPKQLPVHLNVQCPNRPWFFGEPRHPYDPNSLGGPVDHELLGLFILPVDPGQTKGFDHIHKATIEIYQGVLFPRLPPLEPEKVLIPWGLDDNLMGPWEGNVGPPFAYDPIIVAMHEFGHAMRLGHKGIRAFGYDDGSIMRPLLVKGQHAVNRHDHVPGPRVPYDRYPSEGDLRASGESAKQQTPEPATLSMLALGGLALLRRRTTRAERPEKAHKHS